jgi:hypothetical protein
MAWLDGLVINEKWFKFALILIFIIIVIAVLKFVF